METKYEEKAMELTLEDQNFLKAAQVPAAYSTCIHRRVGAVIVKNGIFVSSGYKAVPKGETGCRECNSCACEQASWDLTQCRAIHAAASAILSACKNELEGATIYLAAMDQDGKPLDPQPCLSCRRLLKQVGIQRAIGLDPATGSPKLLDLSTCDDNPKPLTLSEIKRKRMDAIRKAWSRKMQDMAQISISKRQMEVIHLFSQLLRLEYEQTIRFHQIERTFPILFESLDLWNILREYDVGCSGGRGADRHYDYVLYLSSEPDQEGGRDA